MSDLVTVKALRRHTNEYGGVMLKLPPAELELLPEEDRGDALAEYEVDLGIAAMLTRLGLVEIAEPEIVREPSKRRSRKK